jgi:hypothetical protein
MLKSKNRIASSLTLLAMTLRGTVPLLTEVSSIIANGLFLSLWGALLSLRAKRSNPKASQFCRKLLEGGF